MMHYLNAVARQNREKWAYDGALAGPFAAIRQQDHSRWAFAERAQEVKPWRYGATHKTPSGYPDSRLLA
jgi:hypothetical protein